MYKVLLIICASQQHCNDTHFFNRNETELICDQMKTIYDEFRREMQIG